MRPRLLNEILLIALSVFTFIFLKKAITEVAMTSVGGMTNYYTISRVFSKPTGYTTEHDKNEQDKIYWSKNKKITWDDIKGTPDPASSLGAVTYCSIGYSAKLKKDSLNIIVTCFFNKQKSWVKPDQKTTALLKHEQGHFDLNEIYSRKLRKMLSEYKFDKASVKKDIQILYERSWKECYAQQEAYDRETENSRNSAKQQEWDNKISSGLKELDAYSATNVVVLLKEPESLTKN